jgi:hypothetical protein
MALACTASETRRHTGLPDPGPKSLSIINSRLPSVSAYLTLLSIAAAAPAAALNITPYFDSSLTGAANAAQVEGDISLAISTIDAAIATPGNVSIIFSESNSSSYLGETQTNYVSGSYATYVSLLQADASAHPSNTVLATALANLSATTAAYGTRQVLLTTAEARVALGAGVTPCFNSAGVAVPGCGQAYDGVITLSSYYSMNYGTTAVPGQYSEISTIEHEMDEVLGIGGTGTVLNEFNTVIPDSGGLTYGQAFVGPLDLYRCSAGALSLTTATNISTYFSIDGCQTNIIGFNQTGSGDAGDWGPHTYVQSAASSPGNAPTYNTASPEVIALESIGYTAAPEPATLALLGFGVAGLGVIRRKRRIQWPGLGKE